MWVCTFTHYTQAGKKTKTVSYVSRRGESRGDFDERMDTVARAKLRAAVGWEWGFSAVEDAELMVA